MTAKRFAASLLIALPLILSCRSDDSLNPPAIDDPMFRRYVSMGNSITAGFQSAGITDSTQQRAYPVLLALAMGTTFNIPSFNNNAVLGNGCPPPLNNNVTQTRVGPPPPTGCSIRVTTDQPINNVAFPGATVAELLSNLGAPPSATDVYKQFILGGRTEVELMKALDPTFVSVFIGANDVLGSFLDTNPGNPALITSEATFIAKYDSVLDAIESEGARAVLVSVPDITTIPYANMGAIWFCLKNGNGAGGNCGAPFPNQDPTLAGIPTFTVNANCAPVPPAGGGISVLVPWPIGLTKLSTAVGGTPASIDCSVDNEVITATELGAAATALAAYNAHISSEAQARGMAYFDINLALGALVANGTIPRFPNIAPALVGQSVGFGPMFSLDGFHPSSAAHQLIADSLASVINAAYGTTLPVPVCGTVTCPPIN